MSRKSQKKSGRKDRRKAGGPKADEEGPPASLPRQVWDQIGPLGVAVAIALLIRAVVIESYYVPSGSMLPTMLIGDHVFVSKFMFGARIPFTDLRLPSLRDPERGEIVVFALGRKGAGQICPLDECPDYPSEGFVKRIAAIPGDRVEFRDGSLILNGEKSGVVDGEGSFTDDRGREYQVRSETFDENCAHPLLDHPELPGLSQEAMTVPEDRYFMLGDNRDNSNDSRGWGTVHRDNLMGPVLFNYWSWNNRESWASMLNPLTWLNLLWNEMYWDRFGMTYGCRE